MFMKRHLIWAIFLLIIPSIAFSQSIDCKEARNECIREAEDNYNRAKEELKKFGSLNFYEVGHIGVEIPIKGKELEESKCKYKPSTLHVRFGKFLLIDDIKPGGVMQGSKSWEIWGRGPWQSTRNDRWVNEQEIGFELDNKTGEDVFPDKCEAKCDGRINVRWRFQEIK